MHGAEPAPGLYVPGAHSTHVAPSSPVVPGLHLQSVRNAEATDEFEFSGHISQVGLPAPDHVPAAHGRQVSLPDAPVAAE
ncbi:MAG: hypothetical protein EBR51_00110 [Gammaproteobacteria bacterium]|nr:hypothetical protein [Gammaproteobacteria bacterium]